MRSTKNKQVSARSAADLIANAAPRVPGNSARLKNEPAAIADIRLICAHNDGPGASKVTFTDAIKLLRESYSWTGNSRDALDAFCRRTLGRKSYNTP